MTKPNNLFDAMDAIADAMDAIADASREKHPELRESLSDELRLEFRQLQKKYQPSLTK